MKCAAFGLMATLIPLAAHAAPVNIAEMTLGYTYYNKPGATLADHDEAVSKCIQATSDVVSFDHMIGNDKNPIAALLAGTYAKAVVQAAVENCMVVGGWRVVRLSDAEGAPLAMLALNDLRDKLTPWIASSMPPGEVVRAWNNDAGVSTTKRSVIRASRIENGQLSVKATPAGVAVSSPVVAFPAVRLDKRWPVKPIAASDVAKTPADAGVILVRVKGASFNNGLGVIFNRLGPDGSPNPASNDKGPDALRVPGAKNDQGAWVAMVVPPGRWRWSGLSAAAGVVDFCFGAPSFEIKPGEVVYAGTFDLQNQLGPDLDIGPAKMFLGEQPAGASVRAAQYVNGSTSRCSFNVAYAYELPGAPFELGYVGGSQAH